MEEYFNEFIIAKKKELDETLKKLDESQSVDEVKDLSKKIEAIKAEIAAAEEQLAKLKAEKEKEPDNTEPTQDEPQTQTDRSRFNPIGTYRNANGKSVQKRSTRNSMEYREAFMKYVQSGEKSDILQFRSRFGGEIRNNESSTVADLGVLLPMTIEKELIKGLKKDVGKLYDDVRKLNVRGGVRFGVAAFNPTFHRVGETSAPSDRQKVSVSSYVEFGFRMGEIRISQTYINALMEVEEFEQGFIEAMLDSYRAAMDAEIVAGRGSTNNEMEGILVEANKVSGSRIDASHIIEMTAADVADWAKWQSKLFAKLPLSLKSRRAKFVFTNGTWEANIKTLKDNNNRPIAEDWFNQFSGEPVVRYRGHEVTLIEGDIAINSLGFKDFDTASDGDYFGMIWVPDMAYCINSNKEWTIDRYEDKDKCEWVTRGIVVNDGKILDPGYVYLLKKDA